MKATLILENGRTFVGESIGCTDTRVFELVFNTSMVGYQEILTDPSYAGQGIVMSYPLIGNYGVNHEDNESGQPWAEAFVVRCLAPRGSNFRNEGDLESYLKEHHISGIQGIDTRALTKILRNEGSMNCMLTCAERFHIRTVLDELKAHRLTGLVECTTTAETVVCPAQQERYRVAMLDFGAKNSLIRGLNDQGITVVRLNAKTTADEILAGGYDGLVLSNGPGDPAEQEGIIAEVKKLFDAKLPMFGCGLGHQILALAAGGETERLPYGHRGASAPVRDCATGRVHITCQNHGYAVKANSLAGVAEVTYVGVNDASCEGLSYLAHPAFSVQFQPESAPGPKATFGCFAQLLERVKKEGAQHA